MTRQHTCRHNSVSRPLRRPLFKGSFKHLLKMPRRSRLFSFSESASWARTSFSSTLSLVLASWRLFFSRLTSVSTRWPAFSYRTACRSSGFSPDSSATSIIRSAAMPHVIWYLSFFERNVTTWGLFRFLQCGNGGPKLGLAFLQLL